MGPDKFWRILETATDTRLQSIFGKALTSNGNGCATEVGKGSASLGCLLPASPPRVYVNGFGKIRMEVTDSEFDVDLSVTDLRFYKPDFQTPRDSILKDVQRRIDKGTKVILSVGLARQWQKPGDDRKRHWLQVNNIHLEDDPIWQAE